VKKIVVLTSGGDAPGMNAAIRAVVRSALHEGLDVLGCESGFIGLVENRFHAMDSFSVANCIQRGGTILKTGRSKEFFNKEVRAAVIQTLKKQNVDGLVVLGGDGSFQGARILHKEGGPPVIGVPCTIDNDITGTEYTIGFDTARNTGLQAIDKIRDTAYSHDRDFMIEVMGRNTGHLALDVGMAGGAEIIVTPEFPISAEKITKIIEERKRKKLISIMVVAEANHPGHSLQLAEKIKQLSGIEYRVCILGHTQRGGIPTLLDRKTATLMGYEAIQALLAGKNGQMMALVGEKILCVNFPSADDATRYLPNDTLLKINSTLNPL